MLPYLSFLSLSMLGVASNQSRMSLTALTGVHNISVLECWQLDTPFTEVAAGVNVLRMGNVANASLYIMPPRYDSGRHPGPAKQYVWVISGVLHGMLNQQAHGNFSPEWDGLTIVGLVSLPNATDEVVVHGGRYGLMYIDDTADVSTWGHRSTFPGDDETTLLMIPVQNGINPPHKVLYKGPCKINEPVGSGEWTTLNL
ncbi:hypothetical protein F5Y11DRAFT_311202 [Daldinia sp. FL1419]|nr:hypothetical protein F5Y11DRAFT_311202 [Daldinia sp. FL1419]